MQGWHKHHEIEEVLLVQSGKSENRRARKSANCFKNFVQKENLFGCIIVFIGLVILIRYLHHLQYFVFVPQGQNQQECIKK